MMTEKSEADMLRDLHERDINAPAGGAIENFAEAYNVSDSAIPILERFLLSDNLDNRSAALEALIGAKRYDYAADAVLLHFQGRECANVSMEAFDALSYLYLMRIAGNVSAERIAKPTTT
jgi:hypothetical protein